MWWAFWTVGVRPRGVQSRTAFPFCNRVRGRRCACSGSAVAPIQLAGPLMLSRADEKAQAPPPAPEADRRNQREEVTGQPQKAFGSVLQDDQISEASYERHTGSCSRTRTGFVDDDELGPG